MAADFEKELALEASTLWVPEALKKQIDLGFEGGELPVWIDGNAARLRELCDNLIDNAIRYSRSGGRVTVRVSSMPQAMRLPESTAGSVE